MVRQTIKPKTLGEKLIEARNQRHINLDEAAKDLKVPFRYLESLEHNNFDDLPDKNYLKDLLKNYCRYLKISFIDSWILVQSHPNWSNKNTDQVKKKYFIAWPKLAKRSLLFFLALAIIIFWVMKVQEIFSPPFLEISYPQDGSIVESQQIILVGRSEKEVELIVNNQEIFVDENGNFETLVDLQKGLNLIKISAKKRYSRLEEKEIRLLLKD